MKKIFLLSITTVVVVMTAVGTMKMQKVEAAEFSKTHKIMETGEEIVPYADVIVTKYRVKNGQVQYRRWNETKGYWVDSDWITP